MVFRVKCLSGLLMRLQLTSFAAMDNHMCVTGLTEVVRESFSMSISSAQHLSSLGIVYNGKPTSFQTTTVNN